MIIPVGIQRPTKRKRKETNRGGERADSKIGKRLLSTVIRLDSCVADDSGRDAIMKRRLMTVEV